MLDEVGCDMLMEVEGKSVCFLCVLEGRSDMDLKTLIEQRLLNLD